jgi:HEAT repeat protein
MLKAVDAVLPLIQSLNDVSSIVRKSAIRSLGHMGHSRALEAIQTQTGLGSYGRDSYCTAKYIIS